MSQLESFPYALLRLTHALLPTVPSYLFFIYILSLNRFKLFNGQIKRSKLIAAICFEKKKKKKARAFILIFLDLFIFSYIYIFS